MITVTSKSNGDAEREASLLHASVLAGDLAGVRAGLAASPGRASLPVDALGATCLHFAATRGDAAIAAELVAAGAPLDAPDANGWRPLHECAKAGSAEVAALLLRRGADVAAAGQGATWLCSCAAAWRRCA